MEREEAARLVKEFGPSVYRLAYARTGNPADAEDVAQETFLVLLRKGPDRFQSEEHAKAWLLRVAMQRANNWFHAVRRRRETGLEEAELPVGEAEEEGVWEAVQALPPGLRTVVHLFYYEGLSAAEIAGVLGISQGAVKTRLSRARDRLRGILTEGGEDHV